MEFTDVIKNRYACKKYSNRAVEDDKLAAILEAGRVAPTAKNLQEQHVYVLQSADALEKFDGLTYLAYRWRVGLGNRSLGGSMHTP